MTYNLKRIEGTETEHPDYMTLIRRVEEKLDEIRQASPSFNPRDCKIDDIVEVHDCDPEIVPDVALMYGFRRDVCPFGDFYSTHSRETKVRANGVWLPMRKESGVAESDKIVKCDSCSQAYAAGKALRDALDEACNGNALFFKSYTDLNQ